MHKDDLVQVITNGLGSVYHPFIRFLENHLDAVTFDDLYSLLLSEEASLVAENLVKTSIPPSTFVTFTLPTFSSRGGGQFQGRGKGQRGRGRGQTSFSHNQQPHHFSTTPPF